MNYIKIGAIAALLSLPLTTYAIKPTVPDYVNQQNQDLSAFRQYIPVSPQISTPKVVEVTIPNEALGFPVFAVKNTTNSSPLSPYLFVTTAPEATPSSVTASGATGSAAAATDNNYSTYLEFPLSPGASTSGGEIVFTYARPIAASSLSFALDANVALPQNISVYVDTPNGFSTVLAPQSLGPYANSVAFPRTIATVWHVRLLYSQPLRITEIKLDEVTRTERVTGAVRFLAQPGQQYAVYFSADRYVPPAPTESGDLATDTGVLRLGALPVMTNPSFVPTDSDKDGIPDRTDNCVSIANPDQKDSDGNGLGDACEDYDRDGIVNAQDNCIDIPNRDQLDTDADGIGDACDTVDNRITERMPWLPWLGIGIAGAVLLVLAVLAFKYKKVDETPVPPAPGGTL
jgi:hypothetical protein